MKHMSVSQRDIAENLGVSRMTVSRALRRAQVLLTGLLLLATGMFGGSARAADIYVTANGSQTAPYDTWAKAFTNLQDALDYAGAKVSATIYLAGGQTLTGPALGGSHPDNTVFRWQNATNVTLSGGWDTNAAPPTTRATPTVLRRSTANEIRVLTMLSVSNALIEQVTIRDGYVRGNYELNGGGGVFLGGCRAVILSDSIIVSNTAVQSGGPWDSKGKGGGLFLSNSVVTVTNTTIAYNKAPTELCMGGGIYVDGSSRITMSRSLVQNNELHLTIQGGNASKLGGGFYVESGGTLEAYETVFRGNVASDKDVGNGAGGAGFNAGTLRMRNCLVVGNVSSASSGEGLYLGGVATLVNCSVVGNNKVGLLYGGGAVSVTNCIVWGHSKADLANFPTNADGKFLNVGYSLFATPKGMHGVNGCITNNPLFVNAASGDYRLREVPLSPCVDKGADQPWMELATDLDGGPRVQRGKVDMGACEFQSTPPFLRNTGVPVMTTTGATVCAEIMSVGGTPDAVLFVFCGLSDGGTNRRNWANEIRLTGPLTVGTVSASIPTGQANGLWHYRFCATNIYGAGWAENGKCFLAGAVGVKATKRESTEERPAAFVIFRPATATNGPLDIHYTLGGTGVNERDYDRLDGVAVIPAGATDVQLPVVPSFNLGDKQPKTVELTIAPGSYLIGANSKVTILTRAE